MGVEAGVGGREESSGNWEILLAAVSWEQNGTQWTCRVLT